MFPSAAPNDPGYDQLYGLHNTGQTIQGQSGFVGSDINAEAAWDISTGDPNFIVAIIDGGTDPGHIDLQDNMWVNTDEIPGNGVDDDGNGYIDDINGWDFFDDDADMSNDSVGARGDNGIGVAGVNWQVQLMPLKFIGPFSGSTSDAIRAIEYAVDKGVKVSNNSWGGGGFSSSLQSAIANARDLTGHIFVAAAGNDGQNSASYPARYDLDNVISVAATDNRDQIAGFSNRSTTNVDIGAPGVNVLSSVPGNNYAYFSGTSMASPHVAGVTALVYANAPSLGYSDVIANIFDNSRPVSGLASVTRFGAVVDAGASLSNLSVSPSIELRDAPLIVAPGVSDNVVALDGSNGTDSIINGSGLLHYSINGAAFETKSMGHNADSSTIATQLPAVNCDDTLDIFFTVETANFGTVSFPDNAPASVVSVEIGEVVESFADSFDNDQGWTVTNSPSLTDGAWDRGQPVGFNRGNPTSDADGSGFAYLTDNNASDDNSDVDDGTTTLTSPVIDATGGVTVTYNYWLNDVANGELSPEDEFTVDVSTNGGSSWTNVRTYNTPSASWRSDSIQVGSTPQLRVRFTVGDLGEQNVVEAALDAFAVTAVDCTDIVPECPADLTGDGSIDGADLVQLLAAFGTSDAASDITGDGNVDGSDLVQLLSEFGQSCP
jgi:subtilisin family serine protease